MPLIKTDQDFSKYLTDPERRIPETHCSVVCRRSQGTSACRYMCLVAQGFVCVKNTPLKPLIDNVVKTTAAWNAKGDNCDGFGSHEKKESSETAENQKSPP